MTDRERLMLEFPERMCEFCCNFDKEHIGMDGMAFCKLTMTLAYAEDYAGNCMFYNVPKEQIIVPPCKVGDNVFAVSQGPGLCMRWNVHVGKVVDIHLNRHNRLTIRVESGEKYFGYYEPCFVCLTKEEAAAKVKELKERGTENGTGG